MLHDSANEHVSGSLGLAATRHKHLQCHRGKRTQMDKKQGDRHPGQLGHQSRAALIQVCW